MTTPSIQYNTVNLTQSRVKWEPSGRPEKIALVRPIQINIVIMESSKIRLIGEPS